jgi:hypothetical protein
MTQRKFKSGLPGMFDTVERSDFESLRLSIMVSNEIPTFSMALQAIESVLSGFLVRF